MTTTDTATPTEALAWLERGERFDIAVLDMLMPEMDGVGLARAIAAATGDATGGRRLPLVLLTSLGHHNVPSGLFAATLTKPAKPLLLHAALERALTGTSITEVGVASAAALSGHLRILLAEDNKVNQRVQLLMLERLGFRADVAGNGEEVLDAIERVHYDVILMDVRMPEMDGLEATRRIRARTDIRQPRIVAMTASALASDRQLCRDAGMDDYVAKPVRPEELAAALERAGAVGSVGAEAERERAPVPDGPVADGPVAVLDPTVLGNLFRGLGARAGVAEGRLIDTYLSELPKLLAQLEVASRSHSGDSAESETFRRAAHTLKSSSASMGAGRLSELSAALEDRSRDGVPADAEAAVAEIAREGARVHDALTAHRRKLP